MSEYEVELPPLDEEETKSAGYRFDTPCPQGIYPAKVHEAKAGESKAGNPMITLVLHVDGPGGGLKVRSWTVLSQGFRVTELVKALGLARGRLDVRTLPGKSCRVKIKHEEFNDEWVARADRLLPPEEGHESEPQDAKTSMGVADDDCPF